MGMTTDGRAWVLQANMGIKRGASKQEVKQKAALDYAARHVVNVAKSRKPYKDHTSLLVNSYGHKVVEAAVGRTQKDYVAIIYNSAEYAPYVEFKPGYWVLSGAVRIARPDLLVILGDKMKVTMASEGKGGFLSVLHLVT